jgi:hypothetical protein
MTQAMKVAKTDYNESSFPMDFISDLDFEFYLKDIKAFAPEVIHEVDKGDYIEVTFTSFEDLVSAARKFLSHAAGALRDS